MPWLRVPWLRVPWLRVPWLRVPWLRVHQVLRTRFSRLMPSTISIHKPSHLWEGQAAAGCSAAHWKHAVGDD